MRQLRRLWQYFDILEAEVLAGEVKAFVGPGAQHDFHGLAKPRCAFFGRHPKRGEFDTREAAPGAPIDPTAGQNVEAGDFLGKPQRMVEGGERHRRPDAQSLCARCRQCSDHVHRGTHAEAAEMMLGEPNRVIAGAVHDLDPLQRAGIDRRQIDAALRPAEKLQNPELHRRSLSTACQKSSAVRAQRSGCSRLTPCPYPANSSRRPCGRVSARIFCCSDAMRLLSPLNSSTGTLISGSSGLTSAASKHSCKAAAMSGPVLFISAITHSRSCAPA